jgi:adenylyltransferase/sulfurtransferase
MTPRDNVLFANDFYSRQIILKEFGKNGQQKLCAAKVAVVGVGGLGSVSSLYLALAGVGQLRLIDQDIVEVKNLHRQILYTIDDIDYPKAEIAAVKLKKINPLVKTEPITENVNQGNVEHLLAGVDLVIDGLDNMSTRYLVNRACVKLGLPYVFGAAIGMEGNLSVFATPKTPCLECVLPNLSDNNLQRCDSRGVIGVTPGIIGCMQALEAIKVLTGIGEPLKGKLMVCDFTDMSFNTIDITKRTKCDACKGALPTEMQEKLIWVCGTNTVNINPQVPLKLSLPQVCQLIQNLGFHVRVRSQLALVFDYKDFEVSIFSGGRMLIKNVADKQTALNVYRELKKIIKTE